MYFGVHGMSVEPTYALDNRLTDVALDPYFFSLRNRNRIYPDEESVSDEVYNYIMRYKILSDYLLSKSDLQKTLNEINHE
jgi:hypothetical protein